VLKPEIRADFDALEKGFVAEGLAIKKESSEVKSEFVDDCWRRAEAVTDRWIERLERRNYFIQHAAYRAMWDRFDRGTSFPL
jgi:hypothetical protein